METTGQSWNTAAYAAHGRFVADLAGAAAGAQVMGVDVSESMVAAARARGLKVDLHSATGLPYNTAFDGVFSNAALHWIPAAQQHLALAAIRRALKPGGRFVAEMGRQGNIAAIRVALQSVLGRYGIDAEAAAASCFPSPNEYRRLLEDAGFAVHEIALHPRPTPLPGGMEAWLNTFRNGVLDRLAPADRAAAVAETVHLLRGVLSDTHGDWTADYVRLRFRATIHEPGP